MSIIYAIGENIKIYNVHESYSTTDGKQTITFRNNNTKDSLVEYNYSKIYQTIRSEVAKHRNKVFDIIFYTNKGNKVSLIELVNSYDYCNADTILKHMRESIGYIMHIIPEYIKKLELLKSKKGQLNDYLNIEILEIQNKRNIQILSETINKYIHKTSTSIVYNDPNFRSQIHHHNKENNYISDWHINTDKFSIIMKDAEVKKICKKGQNSKTLNLKINYKPIGLDKFGF
jgi:hypothetical protein